MNKRSKFIAITMIAALSVSVFPAVTSVGTYAADATTAATTWTPPATTTPTAPKPTTTAPKPTTTAPKPTTTTTTTKPVVSTSGTVTATGIFRLLVQGSFGEDVKLLQTMLNKLSYKLSVDGIFGKLTAGAVRDFQGKNGLVVDGMVGPKTLAKLAPAAPAAPVVPTAPVSTVGPAVDTVATASIVNTNANFEKSISKDGFWLTAILKNLTFTTPLVLEGAFVNDDGKEARKIALYTQDADHNVIDNFTLTAPKLTIQSPSARLQNGAFVGDIYVNAAKFEIRNTKVTGNVYVSEAGFKLTNAKITGTVFYTTQAAKDGATVDAKSTATGGLILAELDAVTSPSVVDTVTALEKGISKDGKWITSVVRDLKTDKALVVAGEFSKTAPTLARKLSLYSQITNADKTKTVTRRFTLTAPKLTIESPNMDLSNGIFNGDIYVNAEGFKMTSQVVNGNVYFMTQKAKDTFKPDAKSVINGQKVLIEVDAVTNASLVNTAEGLEKGIGVNGGWITSISRDIVVNKALVMEGTFMNTKVPPVEARKLALYSQDADHKTTRDFTLTAQRITIKSPSARIQGGIFDGNVYVEAANFLLTNTTVDGSVYVNAPNFKLTNAKVVGTVIFMNAEVAKTFTKDDKSSITGGTVTVTQ